MTFLELAKARYSVRKFKEQSIEEEKLQAILQAGLVAPTACNYQPQKIYIARSKESREKLSQVCRCTFQAPVIFVVAYDTERVWKNELMQGHPSGETDAAIVCTHMMLEAWEQDLGSCWVGWFNSKEVADILNLPEHIQVTALLPIGYPADGSRPSSRHSKYRELEDIVKEL